MLSSLMDNAPTKPGFEQLQFSVVANSPVHLHAHGLV